ncbi:hypothetical protein DFH08DRAFT_1087713 [Mycena albidolilacea]|uniref:F-box domain-containing protein n=1 Tax=Mycena albidolilacea TaxID=1033008 RepID=A0AAD7ED11_9AGAR|nr:hypothetical protein DFH08DRAFT_1087713 [Mycena albidolilacea]
MSASGQASSELERPHPQHSFISSHASLQEQRDALAAAKSQIMLYKKCIVTLEEEENRLETSLSQVKYPVLDLPVDVTSHIFLHCLPAHGRVAPSPISAPLILAQICRHWREVALSTCGLWNSLYIDGGTDLSTAMGDGTLDPSYSAQHLLRTWFSRAKGSPLSLGLNFRRKWASPALLALVKSYAGQVQRLDLHYRPEQFRKVRPLRTSFPVLQHLATSNSSDEAVWDVLNACPPLRELRLLAEESHNVMIPPLVTSLTQLEISAEISSRLLLQVLNSFPVLSSLKFCLRDSESLSITEPTTPTLYPHISSLSLGSGASTSALHLVTLPNLHFLKLASFSDRDDVQKFLSRSACVIDHLVISFDCDELDVEEDAGDVFEWLATFPTVSVLAITACPNLPAVLSCLALPATAAVLPRLADVSICAPARPATIHNCDDPLVEMLRSRRDNAESPALRRFHLKFTTVNINVSQMWGPGALAQSALMTLVAEGLDFVVKMACGGMIQTWPQEYIEEDPLPYFP